ncbi:MAG TPA: threonine synthase [Actinobacteria bacterium]|nr:threonine synthase [Actinomycetes bacterium]HEX21066.1 threonine synthase [Actinomycetota bacterium]
MSRFIKNLPLSGERGFFNGGKLYIEGLRCRECGREYPISPSHVCEFCFGPLEVVYNYKAIKKDISRDKINAGPLSIWRYIDLLPIEPETRRIDLGVGYTPLIKAENLGNRLGIKDLYIKNDTLNPTNSFKDRVVSVALTRAVEFGFDVAACASTGNLANSVAAHAAKAGMRSFIFIPADLESGKVIATAIYGPNLIAVNGNYDQVNRLCAEIADEYKWAFVNVNIRPFYAEGSKTLAFETVEQLGWKAPDHVVVPMASGSLLTKIKKGLDEFYKVGLIDEPNTKVSGAQATGCSPISQAFKAGLDHIRPVKPDTIAKSLAIGNPADGYYALGAVRETGGSIIDVSDEEIVEAIELLAKTEGIFAETAGGVTIAVLKKLAESGKISADELTVAYVTGLGLKTLDALVDSIGPTAVIEPEIKNFTSLGLV